MDTIMSYIHQAAANLDYLAILALVFFAVGAIVFGLFFAFNRQGEVQKRLSRLLPGGQRPPAASNGARLMETGETGGSFAKLTRPLHNVIAPKEGGTRKQVRLRLIRAGLRSEAAFFNFVAAKVILPLGLPAIYLTLRFFYKLTPDMITTCVILAGIGFFIPDAVIWFMTRARQERITKALPDALDLMVVCVEAGYGLDMTFKRVGEEMRPISPDVSDEFHLTNMEVRAGRPREESFKEMATRTGVAEVHNLMTMLIQTSRFGTSLAKALRVHADAMRIKRRQLAEEKAAKTAVKLVFPLVLFIFPALLIVLAGPAAIRIYYALFPALAR